MRFPAVEKVVNETRRTAARTLASCAALFILISLLFVDDDDDFHHDTRMAKTACCDLRSLLKKLMMRLIKPYFLVIRRWPFADSAALSRRASASIHSPFSLPRTSETAMRTRRLLRRRFILPESASV